LLALAIEVPELCSRDAPSMIALTILADLQSHRCFGGHGGGETPGPIPNPEVKPSRADGTAWETGWESRSLPRLLRNRPPSGGLLLFRPRSDDRCFVP
jgi:hypothetical protein